MTAYDDFAGAGAISLAAGTFISASVSNIGFTQETGEPVEADFGYRSAWWVFTPSVSASVTFDTALMGTGTADANDTKLGVFTGSAVNALTLVDFNDDAGPSNYSSLLTADLTGGVTYHIRVAAYDSSYDQTYILRAAWTIPPVDVAVEVITVGPMIIEPPVVTVEVELPVPASVDFTNDNFARATPVVIESYGGAYTSSAVVSDSFTLETDEPATTGDRSAWWSYTPVVGGSATFGTSSSTAIFNTVPHDPTDPDLTIAVYIGSSLATLSLVDYDETIPGSTVTLSVTGGVTYYIRIARASSFQDATYVLDVTGPLTVAGTIPAIDVEVMLDPSAYPRNVFAPPVQVNVQFPAPASAKVKLLMLEPTAAATVPTQSPRFMLSLSGNGVTTATVTVQYDTSSSFTSPVTLTQTIDLIFGTNYLYFPVSATLVDGQIYYWRAKVAYDAVTLDWLAYRSFLVSVASLVYDAASVAWTVAAGTPSPHLWFAYPPTGIVGDHVKLFGQGFPTSSGTVTLEGVSASIVSWSRISDDGATSGRKIDPLGPTADCEHYEVVITVPDVSAPGGALVVES